MARTVSAMKAGRLRRLEKLKSEGKPVPCGRKKGGRNRPAAERERADREENWLRDCQRMARRLRTTNRKVLREQRHRERQVAADLAMRRERFRAGLPFWTEEEWERL
jgi:2-succinyl-5-enolpyruvyl-6-hydroxy-3-cyclohexene-1-carboxylate synthase